MKLFEYRDFLTMCINFQDFDLKILDFMDKKLNSYIVITKFGILLNLNFREKVIQIRTSYIFFS